MHPGLIQKFELDNQSTEEKRMNDVEMYAQKKEVASFTKYMA